MKNTFNFGDSCIKSMLIKFSSRSSLVNNPSSHGSLDLINYPDSYKIKL